ncbi:NADH-dependent phenylglyoxylate dehydrogenase subunit epsilon [bacterium BMS3Bbin06]|nr:NADH-dependent phenylglyoxylate dehydrogenase subunit epsilon [bacterium BMS3Abin08]GBE35835.1 NADH-dependent phenylglyoxylate dehydrogenase subunit epsilon [bacterium BMS3Bbin06]HDO35744.1 NAD(P)/FAD-dependent oxidoreductase [Nitrospirota bacterium]HDY72383.1 NAD(P)/FAD-dependent oxidoreductase [Nitrospirota bacterium]
MKTVIIGNGVAAVSAVEAIRKRDRNCEITVLSKEGEIAYTPCFLARYVSGEIGKDKLYMRESNFYDENQINTLFNVAVNEVNPGDNTVSLSDGRELVYDRLLLAAGSKPVVPQLPGIEGDGVFFFRTLPDAERIISAVREAEGVVVMGAGFIGLEIAEALSKTGHRVTVVEKEDRVLPRMLDGEVAGILEKHIKAEGINIITGRTIESVKRGGGKQRLEGVVLDKGESISCKVLIVSVGVRPNLEMIRNSSLKTGAGVMTDNRMRTNIPNIYAAGDIAEMEVYGVSRVNPVHINAVAGGEVAGCNMVGAEKVFESHLEDMNVVTLFGLPVLSLGIQKGDRVLKRADSRGIVKIYLGEDERIKGVQLIGDTIRGGIYLSLMRRGVPLSETYDILSSHFNYGSTIKVF